MPTETAASQFNLILDRVFDAPLDLVWQAWTDPAQLTQWWGPKGFTNPVCRADVRPGGAIYVEMRAPNGVTYPMNGTYQEVVLHRKIVFTSAALDQDGKPKFEIHTTVSFAELNGKTTLKLEAKVLNMISADASQHLSGMNQGWSQSLDRLAAFVTKEPI